MWDNSDRTIERNPGANKYGKDANAMDQLSYKHKGQDGANRAQTQEDSIRSVVNVEITF